MNSVSLISEKNPFLQKVTLVALLALYAKHLCRKNIFQRSKMLKYSKKVFFKWLYCSCLKGRTDVSHECSHYFFSGYFANIV